MGFGPEGFGSLTRLSPSKISRHLLVFRLLTLHAAHRALAPHVIHAEWRSVMRSYALLLASLAVHGAVAAYPAGASGRVGPAMTTTSGENTWGWG
jgi:hypothetical protein